MLSQRANELLKVSETLVGIRCEPDEREEGTDAVAPAPRAIDVVAPALLAIVRPQQIHLLQGTTIGLNDSIRPSERLWYM
jgi:hypothetical protein